MASSRPTTPVPDDCPVCLDPLRSGYARVDWCPLHPLCRECADRIRSSGDCRCPLCRQPWHLEELSARRTQVPEIYFVPMWNSNLTPTYTFYRIPEPEPTITVGQLREPSGGDTLTIPLRRCSHGNHGYCGFCAAEEESPFDDMNWEPEGGYDDDPYVQQWNEENEEDVPLYVRTYGVSF